MLHKVSEFCDKFDSIAKDVERLRDLKYNKPKTPQRDLIIDNLIAQIQADCYLISQDKSNYSKNDKTET